MDAVTGRKQHRWWIAALLSVLLAGGVTPYPAGAQEEPLPAGLVAFGHELADRLNRGEDMTAFLAPQDITCPQFTDSGQVTQLCEGVTAGTVVPGCLSGRFGSDAGYGDCAGLGRYLAGVRSSQFAGRALQLFTASANGRTIGGLACPGCVALVYSTAGDAELLPSGRPAVLELQLTAINGEWQIYSLAAGVVHRADGAQEMLFGGTFEGRTFVPVPPAPPGVGTGMADREDNPGVLLTILGALIALAGVVTLVRARQQQQRSAR